MVLWYVFYTLGHLLLDYNIHIEFNTSKTRKLEMHPDTIWPYCTVGDRSICADLGWKSDWRSEFRLFIYFQYFQYFQIQITILNIDCLSILQYVWQPYCKVKVFTCVFILMFNRLSLSLGVEVPSLSWHLQLQLLPPARGPLPYRHSVPPGSVPWLLWCPLLPQQVDIMATCN